MATCIKIRKKKQEVCVGDMIDAVTVQNRALTAPDDGSVDFTLEFTDADDIFAMVETTNAGTTFFDGVDQDIPHTHNVYTHFDATITAQTWLLLETGERLDILQVINLDQRSLYMKLVCTSRGLDSKAAAEA